MSVQRMPPLNAASAEAAVPAVKDPVEFRAGVNDWIKANLPAEWRDISRGTDDAEAVRIRRSWGAQLARAGLAAPRWPREYGGASLDTSHQIIVLEELVEAGAPEALNSNGIGIFGPILIKHGTAAQRDRFLRAMLDHSEIWCQGFSEPNAGSDLASLSTRARFVDDHFLVSGQKLWTSFAGHSDYCYAMVRTDSEGPKHAGISLVIIDMHQPGVSVRSVRNIAGGSEFAEVFLDNVIVPRENLVGELNRGWSIATEALALERGLSFAERSMRLNREVRRLVDLKAEMSAASGGIGEETDDRIVDAFVASRALHSLVLRVLYRIDTPDGGTLASLAKLYWSESHQRMLAIALDLLGDKAGDPEHREWLRSFLFARGETIYAGTSEIQRNLLARAIGLPAGNRPLPGPSNGAE